MKNLLLALSLLLPLTEAQAHTDVRLLGAVGDGVKDDTAVLLSALKEGKSDLFFPKGTYRLTQTLEFDLSSLGYSSVSGDGTAALIMEGPGPAIRFKGSHGGTAVPSTVKHGVWEKERTPMVSGLEIVGRHAEADGVEADGAMQLTITKTVVREARHAIHLTHRNRNLLIADCHLYNNTGIGIYLDAVNLHQTNITNCHISYNGGGGVVSKGGEIRNLQIGSSDIESNHSKSGPPTANVWLDSTGGSTAEVAITGCTIQHTSKAPGSANIRISGHGSDAGLERRTGNRSTNEGHITIGNNVFSDVQVNIEITGARGVTITGNTFWEGFEHDLLIQDSSHIVVTGNNFDRNPRYLVNGFQGTERNGIVFRNCSDSSMTSNVVSGVQQKPAAVLVSDSQRMLINSNSIVDNDGAGLCLENGTHCMVNGNIIRDDRPVAGDGKKDRTPLLKVTGGNGNSIGTNLIPEP